MRPDLPPPPPLGALTEKTEGDGSQVSVSVTTYDGGMHTMAACIPWRNSMSAERRSPT